MIGVSIFSLLMFVASAGAVYGSSAALEVLPLFSTSESVIALITCASSIVSLAAMGVNLVILILVLDLQRKHETGQNQKNAASECHEQTETVSTVTEKTDTENEDEEADDEAEVDSSDEDEGVTEYEYTDEETDEEDKKTKK